MLKSIIQAALRSTGYELRAVPTASAVSQARRGTMAGALEWVAERGFRVNAVLDVGASNGQWSEMSMNAYPKATHVLFEPQPVHSEALDEFVTTHQADGRPTVVVVKQAVGAEVGKTYFDNTDPLGGALMNSPQGAGSVIEVPLTTIDAAVGELGVEGPYLLKLDTHGYEKGILEGSAKTLENAELLIIEVYNHRIADGCLLFGELCAYLAERGFRPLDLVDVIRRPVDGSLWQMDILFARDSWPGFGNVSFQ